MRNNRSRAVKDPRRKCPTRCIFLFISCFLTLGIGLAGVSAQTPSVNGFLRQIGDQKVLDLWGSNYEMGYAHGYMLADKIRDLIDTYMIDVVAGGDVLGYASRVALVDQHHAFCRESLNEIAGMLDGMKASKKGLYIPRLGRNIDDRDIKLFNLAPEYYAGCSSFGVWNRATANGTTILARNYDFFYDSQGNIIKNQMLITYRPTDRPRFVSIGWPGWIGVASGMNEHGISVMLNLGNGDLASGNGPFHPSMEIARSILENINTSNFATLPFTIVDSASQYSPMLFQIGSPWGTTLVRPVYYIEESPSVRASRWAEDTHDFVIGTNHFLIIPPGPSPGDSLERYDDLEKGLITLLEGGDQKVDSYEAWSLLNGVADIAFPTLMSIVLRPNKMEFDVSFAALVSGNFVPAAQVRPQTYSWPMLFPDPDLVVLAVGHDPASPAQGRPMTATVTVKNQGNADSGAFRIDIYRDSPSAPDAGQIGDATCTRSGLAAGGTDSCTFTVAYPSSGEYKMWAQVDTGGQVTELDEQNNLLGPQIIPVRAGNADGGSSGGGGGGGCFIATAAYGSPFAWQVHVFKGFRDRALLKSRPGQMAVRLYYRLSPPVAAFIAPNPSLRSGVRLLLAPAAYMIAYPVQSAAISALCLVFFVIVILSIRIQKEQSGVSV